MNCIVDRDAFRALVVLFGVVVALFLTGVFMFRFIKEVYFFIKNLEKTNERLQRIFCAFMDYETADFRDLRRKMIASVEQDLKDARLVGEYRQRMEQMGNELEGRRNENFRLHAHNVKLNERNEKLVALLEANKIFFIQKEE